MKCANTTKEKEREKEHNVSFRFGTRCGFDDGVCERGPGQIRAEYKLVDNNGP
jgi:hypothetical protein